MSFYVLAITQTRTQTLPKMVFKYSQCESEVLASDFPTQPFTHPVFTALFCIFTVISERILSSGEIDWSFFE